MRGAIMRETQSTGAVHRGGLKTLGKRHAQTRIKEASASEEKTKTRRVNNWQGQKKHERKRQTSIDKAGTADGDDRDGGDVTERHQKSRQRGGKGRWRVQQRLGPSPQDETMESNRSAQKTTKETNVNRRRH